MKAQQFSFFFWEKKKLQIKNSVVSYEQFCFFGNAPWTVGPTEYESWTPENAQGYKRLFHLEASSVFFRIRSQLSAKLSSFSQLLNSTSKNDMKRGRQDQISFNAMMSATQSWSICLQILEEKSWLEEVMAWRCSKHMVVGPCERRIFKWAVIKMSLAM